jgi:hypothetical protein
VAQIELREGEASVVQNSRWISLLVVVSALLLTGSPAAAQFPSQGTQPGGGFPSQQGGFPAQGGSFQSQEFGYSVSWGPQWTVTDQTDATVTLSNGVSFFTLDAFVADPTQTPQDIVLFISENGFNIPLTFSEVVVDDVDEAGAFFDASTEGLGFFIDAMVMERTPNGNSILLMVWQFPQSQFETELEAVLAVTDTLFF